MTEAYLAQRGISTVERYGREDISISGRKSNPITGKLLRWTDAQGREISDLKVYWNFAHRKTGEKLPVSVWHLRLSHYQPRGEILLAPHLRGCAMNVVLGFETDGANVIAVLPIDSAWEYESNGRLEREYLDGISAALQKRRLGAEPKELNP